MLKWILPLTLFSTILFAQQPSPSPSPDPNDIESEVVLLQDFNDTHYGTGFLIKLNGVVHLITAAHVCGKDEYLDSFSEKTSLEMPAKVEKIEPKYDLCMLTSYQNLKAFELSESINMKDNITVIGHPHGDHQKKQHGMVKITYLEKKTYKMPVLLTMLEIPDIVPGNSGSPVLDENGKVVGVILTVALDKDGNPISFAGMAPLTVLKDFLGVK